MKLSIFYVFRIMLITLSAWFSASPTFAQQLDFGDAPATYPTTLAQNGARHTIRPGFFLGAHADAEANGQPNATATGDDTNGIDDEDGVVWPPALAIGRSNLVTVTASAAGKLDAWLDLNRDGDWNDPGERIFTAQPLVAGPNNLSILVPAVSTAGASFARFRFSAVGNLSADGLAPDGEVEDYRVTFAPASAVRQLLNGFAGDPVGSTTLNSDGKQMRITRSSATGDAGVSFALGEAPAVGFEVSPLAPAPALAPMVPGLHLTEQVYGNYNFVVSGKVGGQSRNLLNVMMGPIRRTQSMNVTPNVSFNFPNLTFASSLPGGSATPWTVRLLGAKGTLLPSESTDKLGVAYEDITQAGGGWTAVFTTQDPTSALAKLLLVPKPKPTTPGVMSLSSVGVAPGNVNLTVTLPDGRMVKGVQSILASYSVAQSLVTQTGMPGLESAQILMTEGLGDSYVSNLGVLDGGYLFQGGANGTAGDRSTQFRSARMPGGFKHSIVTDNKDADGTYRLAMDIGFMDYTDNMLFNLIHAGGGWDPIFLRSAFLSSGGYDVTSGISEPGPDLDLGGLDLSKQGRSLRSTCIAPMGIDQPLQGVMAPVGIDQPLQGLRALTVGKSSTSSNIVIRWEGPEFDASKNEVSIETIEIAHEGLNVRSFTSRTLPAADGLLLEVLASPKPLVRLQPSLPTESDGTLAQTISFTEPATFALPDGQTVVGDEITFKTSGLRIIRRLAKAHVELNVPDSPQLDFTYPPLFDWGDAPAPYPTRLVQNGPRHHIVPGLRLGQSIDPERDGLPSSNANGDDRYHRDDEDGVILTSPAVKGGVVNINVFARTPPTGAFVDGFVDFNGDGDFADAGEKVFDKKAVVNGVNALTFSVPSTAKVGKTFARIRLNSTGGLSFDGEAEDGEVEDYAMAIQAAAIPLHASGLVLVPQGGASARIAADGSAQFSDLGGDAGVAMLANENVVSRKAGRIVTQLQPPAPLAYVLQRNESDLFLLDLVGHFRNVEGIDSETEFRIGAGPVSQGVGENPAFFDIFVGDDFLVRISAFDDKGYVGSEETKTGFLGLLRGSGNIMALGYAAFPSSVWIVLDQPATFRFSGNRALTGTVFRLFVFDDSEGKESVTFIGLSLSYTPNASAEALTLRNLAAKNPTAPQITSARLAPGGTGPMLEFQGLADVFYRVDFINQPGQGAWTPGTGYHFGRDARGQLPAPIGGAQRFYRLVVE